VYSIALYCWWFQLCALTAIIHHNDCCSCTDAWRVDGNDVDINLLLQIDFDDPNFSYSDSYSSNVQSSNGQSSSTAAANSSWSALGAPLTAPAAATAAATARTAAGTTVAAAAAAAVMPGNNTGFRAQVKARYILHVVT
jgi:hypothetical protein